MHEGLCSLSVFRKWHSNLNLIHTLQATHSWAWAENKGLGKHCNATFSWELMEVVWNIPIGFSLTVLIWEFSETRNLFFISFCLWEDLSINGFFLFKNASCKLPGRAVMFGGVSVLKKRLWAMWTLELNRELPLAPLLTLSISDPLRHTCAQDYWLLQVVFW